MNNNYGHLTIDTPEKKKKYGPRQRWDEINIGTSITPTWVPATVEREETPFSTLEDDTYRRPLVAESSEWSLVGLDEEIRGGDEIYSQRFGWEKPSASVGKKVSHWVQWGVILAVRRRKSPSLEALIPIGQERQGIGYSQPTQSWISVRERLPEHFPNGEAKPVEVYDERDGKSAVHYSNSPGIISQFTHWKFVEFSAPPLPPPTSASEKAFEEFYGDYIFGGQEARELMKDAWTAALTAKEGSV